MKARGDSLSYGASLPARGTGRVTSPRNCLEDRLATVADMHPDFRPGRWVPDRSAGPTARTWVQTASESPDGLERAIATATHDLERAELARDAAFARWQDAAHVAEAAADYLGVTRRWEGSPCRRSRPSSTSPSSGSRSPGPRPSSPPSAPPPSPM